MLVLRGHVFALIVASTTTLAFAGCSDQTATCEDVDGNACTGAGDTRFTTDGVTVSATYSGKPIVIESANGMLTVTALSGAVISATADLFAFAANQADGAAALADTSLVIDETSIPGKIHVQCKQATSDHGSAAANNTGCGSMQVLVPPGTVDAPVSLTVTGHNGDTSLSGITGQAVVHSDLGNVTVSVTPTLGMSVEASTENGDATLTLPSDFVADQVLIEADNGSFDTTFPDVSPTTTSRGLEGTGAVSVVLWSKVGNIHLETL